MWWLSTRSQLERIVGIGYGIFFGVLFPYLSFSLGTRVKIIFNTLFYCLISIWTHLYTWVSFFSTNIFIIKLLVSFSRSEYSLHLFICCLPRTGNLKALLSLHFTQNCWACSVKVAYLWTMVKIKTYSKKTRALWILKATFIVPPMKTSLNKFNISFLDIYALVSET